MKTLASTARIIFGLPFVVFGSFHFVNGKVMAGAVLANWPAALILVYLAGAGLILAGISFIINKFVKLAGILLAVELLIFILAIHLPGVMNAASMQMSMMGLLKDMSLMAASLFIAAGSAASEDKTV